VAICCQTDLLQFDRYRPTVWGLFYTQRFWELAVLRFSSILLLLRCQLVFTYIYIYNVCVYVLVFQRLMAAVAIGP
jgi:hypothetical protein